MEPMGPTILTPDDQQMAIVTDAKATLSPLDGHFPVAEKLHTEVLALKYGPIHAVKLRHDNVNEVPRGSERIREARLVDEQDILRTYALTFLTYDKTNSEISAIDNAIRGGGLIGQTFKEAKYDVKKNVIDVFMIDLPTYLQADFRTETNNKPRARIIDPGDSEYVEGDSEDLSTVQFKNEEFKIEGKQEIKFAETYQAKARLTEFYAKARRVGSAPVIYGTVLEVYPPDFKDPAKGINNFDRKQINPLTGALQIAGVPADEIWERLDRAAEPDEWADRHDEYEDAKAASKGAVGKLHTKISQYLATESEYLKKAERK